MEKFAHAHWSGDLKNGVGSISTQSGVLQDTAYGFNKRFGDEPGTNPEELIAAAHASCFTMAFSNLLGIEGFSAEAIDTECRITLEKISDGFALTHSHLHMTARVPHITIDKFNEVAATAKAGCPVSKALNLQIDLLAELVSD